ncbi:MAG: nucleoside deaminase [Eubacteriales bacterium]|nr:nucleoside deaminase [Eubacteriales bacterium]
MDDEFYMNIAIKEAKKALLYEDVPIGCVIVYKKNDKNIVMSKHMESININDNAILSKAYNKRNKTNSAINHAEILAIDKACKKIKDFRLENCTMYVTLEPCPMCAGAILQSRIQTLVIGTKSKKSGAAGSIINILDNNKLNHKVKIKYDVLQKECESILQKYFSNIRKKHKQQ